MGADIAVGPASYPAYNVTTAAGFISALESIDVGCTGSAILTVYTIDLNSSIALSSQCSTRG